MLCRSTLANTKVRPSLIKLLNRSRRCSTNSTICCTARMSKTSVWYLLLILSTSSPRSRSLTAQSICTLRHSCKVSTWPITSQHQQTAWTISCIGLMSRQSSTTTSLTRCCIRQLIKLDQSTLCYHSQNSWEATSLSLYQTATNFQSSSSTSGMRFGSASTQVSTT